jgi:EAL domain-containing protein (putative c-di-GMP-specific phosphodiesterase class I)
MANDSEPSTPGWNHEASAEELASAYENDEFFLVYQPTIDLQTSAFAGVEALIRWRHPVEGIVGPDRFIHALERSGMIVEVGRWTLETACRQGALWHSKGYRFTVSVNVARKQFERTEFLDDVTAALTSSRFDPSLLVLEFSQQTLFDGGSQARQLLSELAALGVHAAVDDFSLGHSTLSQLEQFPIDIVKLNRTSIEGIADSDEAAALVHALVELARSRNVQIIASGIEDAEQRRRLQVEQVSIGQGFLFSRPHEVVDIDRFLEDFALFSGRPL